MFNLLSAEFYKLRKGKALFVGLLIVAVLVVMLYVSLMMIDKINSGEVSNGTGGVIVFENGETVAGELGTESMMQKIGIAGVLQQIFSGHFVGLILAVIVSIFVVREFGTGAIKNLVGKGYSRSTIFLSKLLSTVVLSILFQVAAAMIAILIGIPFLGSEGFSIINWTDIAIYTGLQILFGITAAGIFVLMGELTRNLAAAIAVSIGVLLFSTSATALLDLLCHQVGFEPTKYWFLDLMSSCPLTEFDTEFLVRSVLVSIVWFVVAAVLGVLHFQRADVK